MNMYAAYSNVFSIRVYAPALS